MDNDNNDINRIIVAIKEAVQSEEIYLFGSFAYGTPNDDSDYDFFIVLPNDSIKPIDAIQRARRAVRQSNIWSPIDIIADYKSRFDERSKLNTIERKIVRDGVKLYERA
jgi:predicted nucleotidyltransferase